NSIRMKNVPPSGSLEYWLDSIIFAFRSYKKCDIAETIPGLSEHFTINLPMLSLLKLFVDSISIVQNSYYNLINIHYTQIFFVVKKKELSTCHTYANRTKYILKFIFIFLSIFIFFNFMVI